VHQLAAKRPEVGRDMLAASEGAVRDGFQQGVDLVLVGKSGRGAALDGSRRGAAQDESRQVAAQDESRQAVVLDESQREL
jgi:hypothetical protein